MNATTGKFVASTQVGARAGVGNGAMAGACGGEKPGACAGLAGAAEPLSAALVLCPPRGWRLPDVRELWHYRDLAALLALRDIRVRYKQTVLGAAWAILQPLVSVLVLTLFFGRLMGVAKEVGGAPYSVFVLAGLLPWTLFAASVTASSGSVVNNATMVSKVYFPRLILPLAALGAPLVDYLLGLGVLAGLMTWAGVGLSAKVLLLPVLLGLTLLTVLAVSVALASLTVSYRDFRHLLPFILQIWFFLTPVIYPVAIIPQRWRWVLALNPIAGPVSGFRCVLLDQPLDFGGLAISLGVSAAALTVGLLYFKHAEARFADVV